MAETVQQYFVCGNTSRGFINFFPQALMTAERVFLLKGGPGTGKSTLMKTLAGNGQKRGWQVEEILCSSDPDSLDGILLDGGRIAVADATAPHALEPLAPGAIEDYVNLGVGWKHSLLKPHRETIQKINRGIGQWYQALYAHLATARVFYEEREKLYGVVTDFDGVKASAETLTKEILAEAPSTGEDGPVRHRFLDALGEDGIISVAEGLADSTEKRYFIQGPSQRGCGMVLQQLAEAAKAKGLMTEVYHHFFDPKEIAMVVIPALRVCALDSRDEVGVYPSREGDVVTDLFSVATHIAPQDRERIMALTEVLEEKLEEARQCLKKAKALHQQLEKIYHEAMNFSVIETITQDLLQEIFEEEK